MTAHARTNCRALLGCLCLLLTALGCAHAKEVPSAFSYLTAPTPTQELKALLSRPDEAPERSELDLLVYTSQTSEDALTLHAARLSDEVISPLWQRAMTPLSQPVVTGSVVVVSVAREGGAALAVLDAESGRVHFTHPIDLPFVGAEAHGDTLYAVLSQGVTGDAPRESVVLALGLERGDIRFTHRFRASAGAPLIARGALLVPWDRQHLSILDLRTGAALGRLRLADHTLAFLLREGGELYYGYRSFHRLDASAALGLGQASLAEPLDLPVLPADPPPIPDRYVLGPARRSAHGRVRLLARPGHPSAYYVYHRHIFALRRDGGALSVRWAARLEDEVAEVQWRPSGLLVATEAGEVLTLDAEHGNARSLGQVQRIAAATFAGDRDLRAAVTTSDSDQGTEDAAARLITQLRAVAFDRDNRLMASRRLAITALAQYKGPEVTRLLLALRTDGSVRGPLYDALTDALTNREVDAELVREVLSQRYDFVDRTGDPPLDVLVAWLARDPSPKSTEALVGLLHSPRVPARDLSVVADALAQRRDDLATSALLTFLRMYRADSVFATRKDALTRAAEGTFLRGDASVRAHLKAVAEAPTSHGYLRQHLKDLFAHATRDDAGSASTARASVPEIDVNGQALAAEARARLNREDVDAALEAGGPALSACARQIRASAPHLRALRIDLVLAGRGTVEDVRVTPAPPRAAECLTAALTPLPFGRFTQAVQRLVLSLRIGPQTPPDEVVTEAGPWWETTRARIPDEPQPTRALPFWQPRPALRLEDFELEQRPPAAPAANAAEAAPESQRPWWYPTFSDQ